MNFNLLEATWKKLLICLKSLVNMQDQYPLHTTCHVIQLSPNYGSLIKCYMCHDSGAVTSLWWQVIYTAYSKSCYHHVICMMFVTDCSMPIAFYIQYTIQKKECTMICLFSYVQYLNQLHILKCVKPVCQGYNTKGMEKSGF